MKIERTDKNISVAEDIIAWIAGDEDAIASKPDPVVSVQDGRLMFYNAACGTDDDEDVIYERLESDSCGDGWDDDTDGEAMIEYLEKVTEKRE